MSFIENIRNKPHEEKVRIIWAAVILTAALMSILWIATSKISSSTPKDTTIFRTIGRGLRDIGVNFNR